jgi:hypothetical protein
MRLIAALSCSVAAAHGRADENAPADHRQRRPKYWSKNFIHQRMRQPRPGRAAAAPARKRGIGVFHDRRRFRQHRSSCTIAGWCRSD